MGYNPLKASAVGVCAYCCCCASLTRGTVGRAIILAVAEPAFGSGVANLAGVTAYSVRVSPFLVFVF